MQSVKYISTTLAVDSTAEIEFKQHVFTMLAKTRGYFPDHMYVEYC